MQEMNVTIVIPLGDRYDDIVPKLEEKWYPDVEELLQFILDHFDLNEFDSNVRVELYHQLGAIQDAIQHADMKVDWSGYLEYLQYLDTVVMHIHEEISSYLAKMNIIRAPWPAMRVQRYHLGNLYFTIN